jgi:hypothetical protein
MSDGESTCLAKGNNKLLMLIEMPYWFLSMAFSVFNLLHCLGCSCVSVV